MLAAKIHKIPHAQQNSITRAKGMQKKMEASTHRDQHNTKRMDHEQTSAKKHSIHKITFSAWRTPTWQSGNVPQERNSSEKTITLDEAERENTHLKSNGCKDIVRILARR